MTASKPPEKTEAWKDNDGVLYASLGEAIRSNFRLKIEALYSEDDDSPHRNIGINYVLNNTSRLAEMLRDYPLESEVP